MGLWGPGDMGGRIAGHGPWTGEASSPKSGPRREHEDGHRLRGSRGLGEPRSKSGEQTDAQPELRGCKGVVWLHRWGLRPSHSHMGPWLVPLPDGWWGPQGRDRELKLPSPPLPFQLPPHPELQKTLRAWCSSP